MSSNHLLDFIERNVLLQFDGQCLRVATHCADTHTRTINRYWRILQTQNFVGFYTRFPLFFALAIIAFHVNPRDQ
ncbi:Uncharacterised protein [Vibrio cholerae]|nr:Uncharacterised protein [Vibrio cholerae]CSB32778.1 Uncharacterised protein [Vibrio cholerae]